MTFNGHFVGLKAGGSGERASEGASGSLMEAAVGLKKWAILKIGLLSPISETMSSSLSSMMVLVQVDGLAIVEEQGSVFLKWESCMFLEEMKEVKK